jgi:hypothetical protein
MPDPKKEYRKEEFAPDVARTYAQVKENVQAHALAMEASAAMEAALAQTIQDLKEAYPDRKAQLVEALEGARAKVSSEIHAEKMKASRR